MKEQIYTIPVLDAFKSKHECPFCQLYETLERNSINFTLGPSYMEGDVRTETNKKGFCLPHYQMMTKEKNSLGVALMIHTHMNEVHTHLSSLLKKEVPNKGKSSLFSAFSKKDSGEENLHPVQQYLNLIHNSCYICDQIESTFNRYVDTFFYLWKKDDSFSKLVEECNGFCLDHFSLIYGIAPKSLSEKQLSDFYKLIVPLQSRHFERVIEDLDWFIKKFDYRYENEPWKNSQDAVARSIVKVAGVSKS
ncbi:MAG: hypothetical protein GX962_02440 [Epulopiscium sp.]|nr:hypothetical protein [Candidatus Epulonipiscium sp.]